MIKYENSCYCDFVIAYQLLVINLKEFCSKRCSINSEELKIIFKDFKQAHSNLKFYGDTQEQDRLFKDISTKFVKIVTETQKNVNEGSLSLKACKSCLQELMELEESILNLRKMAFDIEKDNVIFGDKLKNEIKQILQAEEIEEETIIKDIENIQNIQEIKQTLIQIQNLSTNEIFYLKLNESNLKMLKWLEEKGVFKNTDIEINFGYNLIIEEF